MRTSQKQRIALYKSDQQQQQQPRPSASAYHLSVTVNRVSVYIEDESQSVRLCSLLMPFLGGGISLQQVSCSFSQLTGA